MHFLAVSGYYFDEIVDFLKVTDNFSEVTVDFFKVTVDFFDVTFDFFEVTRNGEDERKAWAAGFAYCGMVSAEFLAIEDGGEGGIAVGYAKVRCAIFFMSLQATAAFKPGLVGRVLVPALKRQHPNPDRPGWGVGGEGGIRTHGRFPYFSFQD